MPLQQLLWNITYKKANMAWPFFDCASTKLAWQGHSWDRPLCSVAEQTKQKQNKRGGPAHLFFDKGGSWRASWEPKSIRTQQMGVRSKCRVDYQALTLPCFVVLSPKSFIEIWLCQLMPLQQLLWNITYKKANMAWPFFDCASTKLAWQGHSWDRPLCSVAEQTKQKQNKRGGPAHLFFDKGGSWRASWEPKSTRTQQMGVRSKCRVDYQALTLSCFVVLSPKSFIEIWLCQLMPLQQLLWNITYKKANMAWPFFDCASTKLAWQGHSWDRPLCSVAEQTKQKQNKRGGPAHLFHGSQHGLHIMKAVDGQRPA